jgi:hypothetical protein
MATFVMCPAAGAAQGPAMQGLQAQGQVHDLCLLHRHADASGTAKLIARKAIKPDRTTFLICVLLSRGKKEYVDQLLVHLSPHVPSKFRLTEKLVLCHTENDA